MRGLIDGGADILLLETIFDTLGAKAAIVAIENVFEEKGVRLPLMISVTITDRSGRTLSGQTVDAFYVSIRHAQPFSVGINCALGARDMRPYLAELARHRRVLRQQLPECRSAQRVWRIRRTTGRKPPRCSRTSRRAASSTSSAAAAARRRSTSRRSQQAVDGVAPRPLPYESSVAARAAGPAIRPGASPERLSQFSGLEVLTIRPDSNFQMIGERTNVTGSAKFARLIKAGNYTEAVSVAAEQVRGGANMIDVNMDEGMLDSEQAMTTFLNFIATEPEIARVPV